jgi:hypothetical protein
LFKRIAASLFIGYAVGVLIVVIFDCFYEGGWRGGFAILWLSLPTTIVYFVAVWGFAYWRSLSPNVFALALIGFLSAVYPAVFGFFPVYYYRLQFAVPFVAFQLGLLLMIIAISSRRTRSSA